MRQDPIKVLFDEQIFTAQRFGGISRYFAELAREFGQMDGVRANILCPISNNYYANKLSKSVRWGVPAQTPDAWDRYVRFANRQVLNLATKALNPDILHQTYYLMHKRKPRSNVKIVTTVYDMIHELFPADFSCADLTSEYKREAVRKANFVLCISENTRRDLIRLTGIDERRTAVTHLGVDHLPQHDFPNPRHGGRPFLLYVGLRGAYKNFRGLLQAVAVERELKEFDVVCFGGGPLAETERATISELGVPASSISVVAGDDALLTAHYQHAAAFVYPSLYEGFGIPPLEAMTQSCPVVSSDRSSLPEVLGSAAEYFNPEVPSEMAAAILAVVVDTQRANELRALGLAHSRNFTWERCAQQTKLAYDELLAS